MIYFFVPGAPVGKARARVTRTGHSYTPQKTVDYEKAVRDAFLTQCKESYPKDEPLSLSFTAWYPIPKSASKKRRQQMLAGIIRPTVKPDLSNVLKSIEDAIQSDTAYHDDSQIVELGRIRKFYGEEPGVEVWIKGVNEIDAAGTDT